MTGTKKKSNFGKNCIVPPQIAICCGSVCLLCVCACVCVCVSVCVCVCGCVCMCVNFGSVSLRILSFGR